MAGLDPVLAQVVAGAADRPGPFEGTPAEARSRLAAAIKAAPDLYARDNAGTTVTLTASWDGHDVPVDVTRSKSGPGSLIVIFLHGGGYVLGGADLFRDISRRLAVKLSATVVSVDYRLAPEHPFPAQFTDTVAAIEWVHENRAALAGPGARIVLIGESAGANIAAAAGLVIRDAIDAEVLVVPGPNIRALGDLADVPGSMLHVRDLRAIVELAFGGDWETAGAFPASAAACDNLASSPPVLVVTAGYDPTAPIAREYADKVEAAGVAVQRLHLPTMFHPFLGFAAASTGVAEAFDSICSGALALLDELGPHGNVRCPDLTGGSDGRAHGTTSDN